jgi:2-polyprenyl-3-methyl-5-hydroxy-6-metoxy-1,4-benzoquinol methylase|tara:strand:- start:2762 stop:3448 length:687 start_codon:yes stop_codon:yes gene_type:complete
VKNQAKRSIYNFYYQKIVGAKTFMGASFLNYKQREADCIVEYIERQGNSGQIVDIGCSTGYFSRRLADRFGSDTVQGADISQKSIRKCRERHPDIQFHHIGNGFYEDNFGRFEYVLLAHVLEHVDDPLALLEKVKRLMTEQGSLIVSVPQERIRGDSAFPENLYNLIRLKFENVHRVNYCADKLSTVLGEAGLQITDHRYINAFRSKMNERHFSNHSLVAHSEAIPQA